MRRQTRARDFFLSRCCAMHQLNVSTNQIVHLKMPLLSFSLLYVLWLLFFALASVDLHMRRNQVNEPTTKNDDCVRMLGKNFLSCLFSRCVLLIVCGLVCNVQVKSQHYSWQSAQWIKLNQSWDEMIADYIERSMAWSSVSNQRISTQRWCTCRCSLWSSNGYHIAMLTIK